MTRWKPNCCRRGMGAIVICGPRFSGAASVAAALREYYGYRQVDDSAVVERAAAWGVPQAAGRAALQKPSRFAGREARQRSMSKRNRHG